MYLVSQGIGGDESLQNVTIGNVQNVTLMKSVDGGGQWFYYTNTTLNTSIITATWTGSVGVGGVMGANVFYNVSQVQPFGKMANNSGSNKNISVMFTNANSTGIIMVGVRSTEGVLTTNNLIARANQTQVWNNQGGTAPNLDIIKTASSYNVTAKDQNINFSWDQKTAKPWSISALQILPFYPSSADIIFPQYNNSFANQTIIQQNQLINFSSIFTDDIGLSSAIFVINLTGSFFNSTPYSLSGTFVNLSNVTFIQASQGNNVTWYWYFNDTSNNVNVTQWQSFTVQDNTTPLYSDVQKNTSIVLNNQLVNFTANLTDNVMLNNAVFSINLGNGFINSSIYSLSGSWSNVSNVTQVTISQEQTINVTWFWYFNDTNGNSNTTGLNSFIVDTQAPNITILDPMKILYFTLGPNNNIAIIPVNITNSSDGVGYITLFNGTANQTYTSPFNITLDYQGGLNYTMIAYINDSFNNVNQTNVTFQILEPNSPTSGSGGIGGGGYGGGNGFVNITNTTIILPNNITIPNQSFNLTNYSILLFDNLYKNNKIEQNDKISYIIFAAMMLFFLIIIFISRNRKKDKEHRKLKREVKNMNLNQTHQET